jgi:hypothetical protein
VKKNTKPEVELEANEKRFSQVVCGEHEKWIGFCMFVGRNGEPGLH